MQRFKFLICCSIVASLLLPACSQGKRTNTENNELTNSKNLLITNSDALEMLIGLGAADNIIGINDVAMSTFSVKDLNPSAGSWQSPNIEAIVNLNPDMVVSYVNYPAPAGFEDKLEPFNVSVERINCYYMSEFHSDISRLASLVGKENMADSMINDFDMIVDMIKKAVADIDIQKKVYIEFGDFTAMGAESGNNELIVSANAINIAAKLNIQYPKISTEWLLEEDPDVIIKIIPSETINEALHQKLVSRAGWDKLNAVKNKQVFLISNDLCSGPRAMIGCLYVAKWCYPEKFASVDPDSIHSYWMEKYYATTADRDKYVFSLKN